MFWWLQQIEFTNLHLQKVLLLISLYSCQNQNCLHDSKGRFNFAKIMCNLMYFYFVLKLQFLKILSFKKKRSRPKYYTTIQDVQILTKNAVHDSTCRMIKKVHILFINELQKFATCIYSILTLFSLHHFKCYANNYRLLLLLPEKSQKRIVTQ